MCIAHTPARDSRADVEHRGVAFEAGDVVDDLGAGGERGRATAAFDVSIEIGTDRSRQARSIDRDHAAQFFVGATGVA